MTRVVPWMVALLAVGTALLAAPLRAHGVHPDAPPAAPAGTRDAVAVALVAQPPEAIVASSHCPSDDGLPCACGVDRCTNPQPPRVGAAGTPSHRIAPMRRADRPAAPARPIVAASRSPPGSVGARGPPAFS
jgi:hypothetical protein